jgi:hypothetical protein
MKPKKKGGRIPGSPLSARERAQRKAAAKKGGRRRKEWTNGQMIVRQRKLAAKLTQVGSYLAARLCYQIVLAALKPHRNGQLPSMVRGLDLSQVRLFAKELMDRGGVIPVLTQQEMVGESANGPLLVMNQGWLDKDGKLRTDGPPVPVLETGTDAADPEHPGP